MFRALLTAILLLSPTLSAAQSCGTRDLVAELSQEDRTRLDALVARHPFSDGILFKAEKGGQTVTVVGTIHIPEPRLAGIVEQVRAAVETADLLVLEATAEDEKEMQSLAATSPEIFFITEGPTLVDLLTQDQWDMVTQHLADLGIPGFMAAQFQPWYLSLTLAIPPCAIGALQAGEFGLDRQIEFVAEDAGIPVAALDEMEGLLRMFSEDPIEEQLEALILTLETQVDLAATTSTLIEGYFDGRIRETWEFSRILVEELEIEKGLEMFEEMNQRLLIDRNVLWEPKLVNLVEGKSAVVAVGAAHLSGETGVLRALERAGYVISPL